MGLRAWGFRRFTSISVQLPNGGCSQEACLAAHVIIHIYTCMFIQIYTHAYINVSGRGGCVYIDIYIYQV